MLVSVYMHSSVPVVVMVGVVEGEHEGLGKEQEEQDYVVQIESEVHVQ